MVETLYRYTPEEVSPPGETLREMMDERGITQAELARRLGRPAQAINEIVGGRKEITEDTAIELERVLQAPARFWLARESRYREYLARQRAAEAGLSALPWLKQFPIKSLQTCGVLPAGRLTDSVQQAFVEPLLRFFGVASPEGWKAQYNALHAQFRRAKPDKQTDVAAITAWLRMGEIEAAKRTVSEHDAAQLEARLPQMRLLSQQPAAVIGRELVRMCAEVGVVLVFVPALPGTHVSGVARWLNGKPLIQLSLLGKWNDVFWFNFFHEVGHVLKHPQRAVFLDDASSGETVNSTEEQEANRFASDVLLPKPFREELANMALTTAAVKDLANRIGVHAGIVVGQLQHHKRIQYSHPLTRLKARYEIGKPSAK
ncbi:MAG: HigA family addiction module antitoxin [Hydrogenophaga sp.]